MFSVVIPIYNEGKNLNSLIKEIKAALTNFEDYELIFVNDCSTDNTIEILKEESKNFSFKLLNNITNLGQSHSIVVGIKNAKYNIIVTLDGDGQNNPKDIPKLVDYYVENDDISLVGGIRIKRKDNLIKIFSSKIANFIRSKYLNDNCADTGCSLKVFDKKIFLNFDYFNGIHRFIPALFNGFGYNTIFLNVDHRKRIHGKSKYGTFLRLINGLRDMFKVKKIIEENNKSKK